MLFSPENFLASFLASYSVAVSNPVFVAFGFFVSGVGVSVLPFTCCGRVTLVAGEPLAGLPHWFLSGSLVSKLFVVPPRRGVFFHFA